MSLVVPKTPLGGLSQLVSAQKGLSFLGHPERTSKQLIQQLQPQQKATRSKKKSVSASKGVITRQDYPELVKLKLAGHTEKKIAERLGVKKDHLVVHLSRALADYRSGNLLVDGGDAVTEGRKRAKDEATETVKSMNPAGSSRAEPTFVAEPITNPFVSVTV